MLGKGWGGGWKVTPSCRIHSPASIAGRGRDPTRLSFGWEGMEGAPQNLASEPSPLEREERGWGRRARSPSPWEGKGAAMFSKEEAEK